MSAPAKVQNELVVRYLTSLATRPIYTKAVTAAILGFVQEVLSNHLAGLAVHASKDASPPKKLLAAAKIDLRALKIAAYGFFIGAPMGHYLVGAIMKFFAGKTSPGAKIGQLLANNLIAAPIQTFVYLSALAIIGGADSAKSILASVKQGYFKTLQITWAASPVAVFISQRYVPMPFWPLFFNFVSFTIGTTLNTVVKKAKIRALAAKLRKEKALREQEERDRLKEQELLEGKKF
ncbi:hypothetical protein DL93DRAFT_2158738 [Clavulina sp. PMI_390]|nr:hypothetical protein DL93DRAFT_2158738 [Clavulina sp. PMI_390]